MDGQYCGHLNELFHLYTGYKIIRISIAGIMDESYQELLILLVELLNKERSEEWIDFITSAL